jgi:hypothetical protein
MYIMNMHKSKVKQKQGPIEFAIQKDKRGICQTKHCQGLVQKTLCQERGRRENEKVGGEQITEVPEGMNSLCMTRA